MVANEKIDRLKKIYNRISDLQHAAAILDWDQETYMPPGAGTARANQVATLTTLAHELATSDEVGTLLDTLSRESDSFSENSNDQKLVEVGKEDFDKASRLSPGLVGRIARAVSLAKDSWREAKENNRFDLFSSDLERLLELVAEKAEARGYKEHIYDALLDEYEPDLTTRKLDSIFDPLRDKLVKIVAKIAQADDPGDATLRKSYDVQKQWDFGIEVIRAFGYDFDRGRQDYSAHPFTTTFSVNDVRITTRIKENFFNPGFFGTLHEAGHALYEQGVDPVLERLPLASGTSLGMHESQSRFWENLVGRSLPFWQRFYPRLQQVFPDATRGVPLRQFYREVNRVRPSLIRVEADEVTYNLHIMLRYEIEKALFDRSVQVPDLPEFWNSRMSDYLGIVPDKNANGVLQDIHWALGAFGYFPTYSLGNLMSTQIFESMDEDLPDVADHVREGRFGEIREWLRANIHQHGRKLKAERILQDVSGSALSSDSWLRYIQKKYSDLYQIDLTL